jgi:hypothetical protein
MAALTHAQARHRFAVMRRFMERDTTRGLRNAQANYLVAVGLLTYIEAIGGLITGNLGIPYQHSRTNFDAALAEMPAGYSTFQVTLNRGTTAKSGTGIYEIYRCGMVHQYAPVESFMVWANQSGKARPNLLGFQWDAVPAAGQRLAVNTNELLRDFKALLAKVSHWIATNDPNYYPLIRQSLERIDGFTVHP